MEDTTTKADLKRMRRQASAELGPTANVHEPCGFGRIGLVWTIERTESGKTRRYYGLTFEEAMQNARDDNEGPLAKPMGCQDCENRKFEWHAVNTSRGLTDLCDRCFQKFRESLPQSRSTRRVARYARSVKQTPADKKRQLVMF